MKKFFVRHYYRPGSLHAYVLAESREEIEARFRDVDVCSEPPEWLSPEIESVLETYSIDDPGGWLSLMKKKPADSKKN